MKQKIVRKLKELLINKVASSSVIPGRLRIKIYNMCGMKIKASSMWYDIDFRGTNIEIGEGSWVNRKCSFDCDTAKIEIGKNCAIGMNTLFLTNTHEIGNEECRCGKNFKKGITIEDGCWIGARATILPDVTIGKGCVIGAGSLVNKDCKPNGLYAGVPARRIKDLSSDDKILKVVSQ